jgi:hypothetical protein
VVSVFPYQVEQVFRTDTHNVAAGLACEALWRRLDDCTYQIGQLDDFAHAHDRRADYGEAREDAAADVDSITAGLATILEALQRLVAVAGIRL